MFSSKKLRKRLHKWCSDNLSFTKEKDYQNGTKRNKINPKKLSLILEKILLLYYINVLFSLQKSPFRDTEPPFRDSERPFQSTERTFRITERRFIYKRQNKFIMNRKQFV